MSQSVHKLPRTMTEDLSLTQENDKHGGDRATPVRTTLVGSQTPILLQTAKLRLVNLGSENP